MHWVASETDLDDATRATVERLLTYGPPYAGDAPGANVATVVAAMKLRREIGGHVGLDESRCHDVERDGTRAQLPGQRPGQAHEPGLGRRVVALAG